MKHENILQRMIRRFQCFYSIYMWKEIVRRFSILGKEILPKKGKNEGNLDFQMWKQGIQNPSRESVVKWLCQDTFFLLNCSSKNGLKSYGTVIAFCSAAERIQGPRGKREFPPLPWYSAIFTCSFRQGRADWGRGGVTPSNVFKFARNLIKGQPCCKRVGNNIFCDLFFSNNSWSIGQNALPPNKRCLRTSLLFGPQGVHFRKIYLYREKLTFGPVSTSLIIWFRQLVTVCSNPRPRFHGLQIQVLSMPLRK